MIQNPNYHHIDLQGDESMEFDNNPLKLNKPEKESRYSLPFMNMSPKNNNDNKKSVFIFNNSGGMDRIVSIKIDSILSQLYIWIY